MLKPGKPLFIKTRLLGVSLLLKALLPMWITLFLMIFVVQNTSENANRKMINIYNHEVDILLLNFNKIQSNVNDLKKNYDITIAQLTKIKTDMTEYIDEKSRIGEIFWNNIKAKFSENVEGFNQFKALLVEKLNKHIAIINVLISNMKDYILSVLNYKDELFKFLNDLKAQLKPLNDMVEALDKIDVLGIFDPIKFNFPSLPSFPQFPSINWPQIKLDIEVDLSEIKKQAALLGKDIAEDIETLKGSLIEMIKLPKLDVKFLSMDTLGIRFLEPVNNMVSVLNAYSAEFRVAKIRINDAVIEKKEQMVPWINVFKWSILIWASSAFVIYLYNLKRNIKNALTMIRGNKPEVFRL